MTARRSARKGQVSPAALAGLGAVVLALIVAAHWLAVVLLLAGLGGGGYALGRRHRPARRGPSPASPSPAVAVLARVTAERDEMARQVAAWRQWWGGQSAELAERERQAAAVAAERDRLSARVAELTDACHAAWDAAANRGARRAEPDSDPPPMVAAMLADRFSGVRRLGPG